MPDARPALADTPADSPTAAYHNFALGHWLRQHGRLEKSEPYLREAVRIYRTLPNPPREYYLAALDGLFQLIRRRDDSLDESIALFHECMHNMALLYGADHRQLGPHYFGFAQALEQYGRSAEIVPLLVEGLRIYRRARGPEWDAGAKLEPAPAQVGDGRRRQIVLRRDRAREAVARVAGAAGLAGVGGGVADGQRQAERVQAERPRGLGDVRGDRRERSRLVRERSRPRRLRRVVARHAGEMIAEAVLAIEMGATAYDLAKTIHPHPTLSEMLWEAADKAGE